MDTSQEKITKASKLITVLLKLAFLICNCILLLALAAIGILVLSDGELHSSFVAAFDVTANNQTTLSLAPQSLLTMFAFMLADTILIAAMLFLIHSIFRDMARGKTPFTHKNSVRIKAIAVLTIILSIIGSYSDALVDYYTIGELSWRANGIGLAIGAVIYCISLIFSYGCELQRESDETL